MLSAVPDGSARGDVSPWSSARRSWRCPPCSRRRCRRRPSATRACWQLLRLQRPTRRRWVCRRHSGSSGALGPTPYRDPLGFVTFFNGASILRGRPTDLRRPDRQPQLGHGDDVRPLPGHPHDPRRPRPVPAAVQRDRGSDRHADRQRAGLEHFADVLGEPIGLRPGDDVHGERHPQRRRYAGRQRPVPGRRHRPRGAADPRRERPRRHDNRGPARGTPQHHRALHLERR